MIFWLIVMIVLGFLSAALTAYKKNYYVRVFDDILGIDEEGTPSERLGRSFVYGFLFPVYLFLVALLLIALASFLVSAGIIAAVIFVLVWITEKIFPNAALGAVVESVLEKIGVRCVKPEPAAAPAATSVTPPPPPPPPAPPAASAPQVDESADEAENPFPGGNINRSRRHTLD